MGRPLGRRGAESCRPKDRPTGVRYVYVGRPLGRRGTKFCRPEDRPTGLGGVGICWFKDRFTGVRV